MMNFITIQTIDGVLIVKEDSRVVWKLDQKSGEIEEFAELSFIPRNYVNTLCGHLYLTLVMAQFGFFIYLVIKTL